jgi:hypothetical protein
MFNVVKLLWREARGTQLHEEYMDLVRRHLPGLSEIQAERCGRAILYLSNDWVLKFGPLEGSSVSTKKLVVGKLRNMAKQRYDTDIGAAFGCGLFSMYVEASYLPGDDARTVYNLSMAYISSVAETARKVDGWRYWA